MPAEKVPTMESPNVIRGVSVFVLILFTAYLVFRFAIRGFPDFYSPEDKEKEYLNTLYHLPILLPALLGWAVAGRKERSRWIPIGYLIYGLLALILYTSPVWSGDALETGLSFMLFGLPFGIIFGIALVIFLLRTGKNQ